MTLDPVFSKSGSKVTKPSTPSPSLPAQPLRLEPLVNLRTPRLRHSAGTPCDHNVHPILPDSQPQRSVLNPPLWGRVLWLDWMERNAIGQWFEFFLGHIIIPTPSGDSTLPRTSPPLQELPHRRKDPRRPLRDPNCDTAV